MKGPRTHLTAVAVKAQSHLCSFSMFCSAFHGPKAHTNQTRPVEKVLKDCTPQMTWDGYKNPALHTHARCVFCYNTQIADFSQTLDKNLKILNRKSFNSVINVFSAFEISILEKVCTC